MDLVTYPIGEDRRLDHLQYLRPRVPGVRSVAVGPSWAKVVLNGAVVARSFREAVVRRARYDVVHTHEEAGLFGPFLSRLTSAPHVYDMGNDWSDVLCNYGLNSTNPVKTRGLAPERSNPALGRSACPLPADRGAGEVGCRNASRDGVQHLARPDPDPSLVAEISRKWVPAGAKVVLYTGTLEAYQGIALLLDAMVVVAREHPDALLLVVGGRPDQIEEFARRANELGIGSRVRLTGVVSSSHIPSYLEIADVLVSPRSEATTRHSRSSRTCALGDPSWRPTS